MNTPRADEFRGPNYLNVWELATNMEKGLHPHIRKGFLKDRRRFPLEA
jgi:hypothetical protein